MKKVILTILSLFLILIISGCQNITPKPSKIMIDPNIPMVNGIKTLSDMTEIAFEWTPIYTEGIKGYAIYRSDPLGSEDKLKRVATVDDRYTSHYVDTKLVPGTVYYYRMSALGTNGRESEPSDVIEVKTTPLLSSVPFVKAINGLPHRIKIIWRPHPNPRVESYIIQRNDLSDLKWHDIATIDGRLNAEFIDKGLENNKPYRYRVRVKTYDGIISSPSSIVEAKTRPLPPVVTNLRATRDLPKRIVVSWDESRNKDFAYYKVYRAISPYLFYTYLAKTIDNSFEDLIGKDGVARYYKVTEVDKEGLESLKQDNPVMGTTLSPPKSPVLTNVSFVNNHVQIVWTPSDDRAVKYTVFKRVSSGFNGKKIKYVNIYKNRYIDNDVVPGKSYKYSVIAIDKYNISSKPTEEISVDIPKAMSN